MFAALCRDAATVVWRWQKNGLATGAGGVTVAPTMKRLSAKVKNGDSHRARSSLAYLMDIPGISWLPKLQHLAET
jgi:hypothetical protein